MEANREGSAVFGSCSVNLQTEGGLCLSLRCSLCSDSCVLACAQDTRQFYLCFFSARDRLKYAFVSARGTCAQEL